MKINKENAGWIFCCVLLLCLLAGSIYMGLSGWYFQNQSQYQTDLMIGDNRQIGLYANRAQALSFGIDGSYLPGEKLPQVIAIKNAEERDMAVRAKIFIDGNQESPLEVEATANWTYNENDMYYYLEQPLLAKNKIGFCSDIILSENLNMNSREKYIITIIFEALDLDQDVAKIWGKNN